MCSWCWGFRPTLQKLCEHLPEQIRFQKLLGGLAADNTQLMPAAMREHLQDTWRRIMRQIPGTHFNFDFWQTCEPRRSTYPACRAVIAARRLNASLEDPMILAIQRAYYLHARNPSDPDTLIELAAGLGLPPEPFRVCLNDPQTQQQLTHEIAQCRALQLTTFPSLMLQLSDGEQRHLEVDYLDPQPMLQKLRSQVA